MANILIEMVNLEIEITNNMKNCQLEKYLFERSGTKLSKKRNSKFRQNLITFAFSQFSREKLFVRLLAKCLPLKLLRMLL